MRTYLAYGMRVIEWTGQRDADRLKVEAPLGLITITKNLSDMDALARAWLIERGLTVIDPKHLPDPDKCPVCGSHSVEGERYEDLPNNLVHQLVDCTNCGATYSVLFTLLDVTTLTKEDN